MDPLTLSQPTDDDAQSPWNENILGLYDLLITDSLNSPSLTVQWLPTVEYKRERLSEKITPELQYRQKLMLGTHNPNGENHIIIAFLLFNYECFMSKLNLDLNSGTPRILEIEAEIKHEGSVNRARYMPQNPSIIATKTTSGDVLIFNLRKHTSRLRNAAFCRPDLRLKGVSGEGYGLSWNPNRRGYILSCSSEERAICLWDINAKKTAAGLVKILNKFYRAHELGVSDCAWHSLHASLFGSVGGSRSFHIWDIRANLTKMPALTAIGHKASVNCLSFNYFCEYLLATGSSDKTVAIWDMRNMRSPRYIFSWHKDETFHVQWSPNNESILASSGSDNRLLVWDISNIGEHQSSGDAKEGPPELLFIHGGHTAKISDFSWNPTEPWLISSVSSNKIIQIWQMGEHVYNDNFDQSSTPLECPPSILQPLPEQSASFELKPKKHKTSPSSPSTAMQASPQYLSLSDSIALQEPSEHRGMSEWPASSSSSQDPPSPKLQICSGSASSLLGPALLPLQVSTKYPTLLYPNVFPESPKTPDHIEPPKLLTSSESMVVLESTAPPKHQEMQDQQVLVNSLKVPATAGPFGFPKLPLKQESIVIPDSPASPDPPQAPVSPDPIDFWKSEMPLTPDSIVKSESTVSSISSENCPILIYSEMLPLVGSPSSDCSMVTKWTPSPEAPSSPEMSDDQELWPLASPTLPYDSSLTPDYILSPISSDPASSPSSNSPLSEPHQS